MASNVLTGAYRVFIRATVFTPSQIDNAIATTGAGAGEIPNTGWKQIFTNGNVSIRFSRETINLTTNQEGIRKIVFSSPDTVEISIPFADISYETIAKYVRVNPTNITSTPRVGLRGSYYGADATQNYLPLFIYHLAYDPDNNTDTPKLGTGSDPMAFLFFGVVPAGEIELAYEPDAQQIFTITFRAISVDGANNKGVVGAFGSFNNA